MIAEESIGPVIIDEFPPTRIGRAIVQENDGGFACPQQIERKFQRPEFLRTVDQDGVARLNKSWKNIAGIAKETFDVAMRRKPAERNCVVGRSSLELNAYDPRLGETVCQR